MSGSYGYGPPPEGGHTQASQQPRQDQGAYTGNTYGGPQEAEPSGYYQAYGQPSEGYGQPYGVQPGYGPPAQPYAGTYQGYPGGGAREQSGGAPLSVASYFLMELLLFLPIINIIMMIVWSVDGSNVHRRNYARAKLIWCLVYTVIMVLLIVLTLHMFALWLGMSGVGELWTQMWMMFDIIRYGGVYDIPEYFGGYDGIEDYFGEYFGGYGDIEDYFSEYFGGGPEEFFEYFFGNGDISDYLEGFGGNLTRHSPA